jgi:hypothetical protein
LRIFARCLTVTLLISPSGDSDSASSNNDWRDTFEARSSAITLTSLACAHGKHNTGPIGGYHRSGCSEASEMCCSIFKQCRTRRIVVVM